MAADRLNNQVCTNNPGSPQLFQQRHAAHRDLSSPGAYTPVYTRRPVRSGLLSVKGGVPSAIDNQTCLVKVPVARKQMEEDAKSAGAPTETGTGTEGIITGPPGGAGVVTDGGGAAPAGSGRPTAFVGSVKLNGSRVGRDAGRIADEVLAHLAALPGADVAVTLEVHVHVGEGVSEDVVRIVSENATALKFDHASFEKE